MVHSYFMKGLEEQIFLYGDNQKRALGCMLLP